LKIKIICTDKYCKYSKDGWCSCEELVLQASAEEFAGRGAPDYSLRILSCASFKAKPAVEFFKKKTLKGTGISEKPEAPKERKECRAPMESQMEPGRII